MFQQLVPLLRQRSVLLTVTHLGEDEIRVNLMPKKLADCENSALTTPMSFTGTAVELDEQLPAAISSFIASHLELKNTLARAKEEMDAAAKAAQEEARNKAKNSKRSATGMANKPESTKQLELKKEPERPDVPSLFDSPLGSATRFAAATPSAAVTDARSLDEEDDIMIEISENEVGSSVGEEDEQTD